MNLDEQLRAALTQEADMQTTPQPDVDGLISGGRLRRRRRNMAWVAGGAVAAVLVGAAVYGVTQIDRGSSEGQPAPATQGPSESSASAPQAYVDTDGGAIEPGTYRKYVGSNAAGRPIEADLTFEDTGWASGNQPTVSEDPAWASVGVYQVLAVEGGPPCSGGDATLRDPAATPQRLADQLAMLPRSAVIQGPTRTQAFGHPAVRLRLRIDDRCPDVGEAYRVLETPWGSRGISYSDGSKDVVIDFLVVDLGGTAVVVDLCYAADASAALVDRATEVRDSITFVTEE